jgi:hypothetical protein
MMNGTSTVNEQLIGKFHVVHVDKVSSNTLSNTDQSTMTSIQQTSAITDESTCASRFQMIRVDRNFGRGRWKVNDYEPPENTSVLAFSSLNTNDNEPNLMSNVSVGSNQSGIGTNLSRPVPTGLTTDPNVITATVNSQSILLSFDAFISLDYVDK